MTVDTNPQWPVAVQALLVAFEQARIVEADGSERWSARQLGKLLGYSQWQAFQGPITKAKTSCEDLGAATSHHFIPVNEMIVIGKGGKRSIDDIELTRFACYLIAQNGDPAKRPQIGAMQIYFAIQTLKQEHLEKALELEAKRQAEMQRLDARDAVKKHNVSLVETAATAGVTQFRNFNGAGVKGLYGMSQAKVLERKGLPAGENHIDFAGFEELGAYLFKATQAEAKIKREGIKGQRNASAAHKEIGEKVRAFIIDIGGTPPEDLPPQEHIDKVRRRIEPPAAAKPKIAKKDAA